MPEVAILGCGPAGLLAAHSARQSGYDFDILSRKIPSTLYGAQFLEKQIHGLQTPSQYIEISLQGTEYDYRMKVYGPDYAGPVSPLQYVGVKKVWDIRSVYRRLWEEYEDFIIDFNFTPGSTKDTLDLLLKEYDFVFSTIPAPTLCQGSHKFVSQKVFAIGDAHDLGVRCPVRVQPGTVIYDGTKWSGWYRAANVFDYCTAEWPAVDGKKKPPLANITEVQKPISNDCDCFPGITRLGRYGQWKKGVLVVDAYEESFRIMQKHGADK